MIIRGGEGEIEEERKEIRMGKVSTSARCSRTIKLYESFPGRGEGPAARLSNPLRGILDDLAISIGTGEWSRDFGPPPTVPKGFERIERKREREGRLDEFPAPGQVNPLSSNIETNYRSPALVIIRLQINAFKLSAFSKLPPDSARKYAPPSDFLLPPCDGFAVSRENSR